MPMTTEAKRQLASTIRALRERLLTDLHSATEAAYQLSISRVQDTSLDEAGRRRRGRLLGWMAEQQQADQARALADFRLEAEQQAAYTLLNRLVLLRLLEAMGLRRAKVLSGGWQSRAYQEFREMAPALVRDDASEGYGFLLQLVFEELALELPGLYGPAGVATLIPVPPATLRAVVEALNDPGLESCWTDELTLGWVYQYWNDPQREALDEKIHGGGKIEPHEIASKTQMFTERYIVDWLLQNSLGPLWLAICQRHGWTPQVVAEGTLEELEARRVDWRAKREAGEVDLTALMPLHTEAERRWAYYVPQPIPADALEKAPDSLREIRLLDVAVGSGHFLVVAFELLFALYQEEAHHRGLVDDPAWSDRAIVESILENNLHGVDIDPRAVQIAAAALWLRARQYCADARPGRLNLVASALRLGGLRDDDPALVELREAVAEETGIPGELTDRIIRALRGADHLGTLLRVDREVDETIQRYERREAALADRRTPDMFDETPMGVADFQADAARRTVLERLEVFLARHTAGDDLGLRLRGEQLAAGVRFLRLVRAGSYHLVVGNPPYQGTSRMRDSREVERCYPLGKADLYAAFLQRGLELVREGGVSALLTMRNWMFIKQYKGLREWLLGGFDLRGLGDFDRGAFEEVPDEVVSVVVSVFQKEPPRGTGSFALQPTPLEDTSRDRQRTRRKRAATVCQMGRYEFDPETLKVVPEWPVVYWWNYEMLNAYRSSPLIGSIAPGRLGVRTSDDTRFLRIPWELIPDAVSVSKTPLGSEAYDWAPYIKGGEGRTWIEPLSTHFRWTSTGLEVKVKLQMAYNMSTQSPEFYFRRGVAFSMIGAKFGARVHRYPSIFGNKGSSVFPDDLANAVCSMNSTRARHILQSLNPGIGFEVGDVNRLPLFPIPNADDIYTTLDTAFTTHESHREPSVEFRTPGPSPWRHAQDWAQRAVDRPAGEPLPPYEPELDPEPPTDHLSFALGVALGRFDAEGGGILDPTRDKLDHALPHGILFLDGSLASDAPGDSLDHPAAHPLLDAWHTHGPSIAAKTDLRTWLRLKCFPDVHRTLYENRPIHWPLSSPRRSFVAWINIHRWTPRTLRFLLADHLHPSLTRLDGEINDLRSARDSAEPQNARDAEKRLAPLLKHREELAEFIKLVEQCADQGPPPPDAKTPARETDAPYAPDLDDGVMINSAALWPLLEPQWKDPKKWWKELASASGKKDYDWSHLAMRYWPTRVDEKCRQDPSLAVAHGCFWTYHPARAWAWELRLQDEISPDFRIEEAPYRDHPEHSTLRQRFLHDQPQQALTAIAKEAQRRRGRGKKARPLAEMHILEPSLWRQHPAACWELEEQIIHQQSADFQLRAPDEPEARAAFMAANRGKVDERRGLLASLDLRGGLLDLEDEDLEEDDEP